MNQFQELEQKIRQAIPELKEEWEVLQEGAIDRDMITPIMLNHAMMYMHLFEAYCIDVKNLLWLCHYKRAEWNLKSAYLKDQSPELINFLNELK